MSDDVKKFCSDCLQCIKLSDGRQVPRPLGQQLISEYPGEIVSFDFIHVGKSEAGYNYVLVIICKMSKTVMLVPSTNCTAPDAARALLRWCALYGLPQW